MFEKYRFGRSVNGEVENEKNRRGRCERSLSPFFLFAASSANTQQVATAPKFIRENSPVIALTHVQLIDGIGKHLSKLVDSKFAGLREDKNPRSVIKEGVG